MEEGSSRMSSIAYTLQHLHGRFNEELFPEHEGMYLRADDRMLKNMLMDLNDRCEDYGMKININKTKTMVIGRKPKKIEMRIKVLRRTSGQLQILGV